MRLPFLWLLPLLLPAGACTKDVDAGDPVPSAQGAVQPEGDGTSVTLADACEAIVAVQDDARDRLGCDAVELECPDSVMPAGSAACVTIDGGSVDACAEIIEDYRDCDDFSNRPCILTTLESEGCGAGGAGSSSGGSGGVGDSAEGGVSGALVAPGGGAEGGAP